MNEHTIAQLAFEHWYAQPTRDRSRAGLSVLVCSYATSYYGPAGTWPAEIVDLASRAAEEAQGKVRPWHLPTVDAIDQVTR